MSRLEGLPALNRRLNAISKHRDLLREVQINSVGEAKRRVKRKTGHTARTIRPGDLADDYAIIEAGGAALYLEFPTKPHIIKPRRKRVLAWPASAGDARLSGRPRTGAKMRFARIVHHPGTKEQPFMIPSVKWALDKVGITKIIERWNRAA